MNTSMNLNSHMCKFVLDNRQCPKGKKCTYAHRTCNIRKLPIGLRKLKLCEYHERGGRCPFRMDECNFAHGVDDLCCPHKTTIMRPEAKQPMQYSLLSQDTSTLLHCNDTSSSSTAGHRSRHNAVVREEALQLPTAKDHCQVTYGSPFCADTGRLFEVMKVPLRQTVKAIPLKRRVLHANVVLEILRAINSAIAKRKAADVTELEVRGRHHASCKNAEFPTPTTAEKDCDCEIVPAVQKGDRTAVEDIMTRDVRWVSLTTAQNERRKIPAELAFEFLGTRRLKRLLYGIPVVKVSNCATEGAARSGLQPHSARFEVQVDSERWAAYQIDLKLRIESTSFSVTDYYSREDYAVAIHEHLPLPMSKAYCNRPTDTICHRLPSIMHAGPATLANEMYTKGSVLMCELCHCLLFQPVMLGCGHVYCYRCLCARRSNKDTQNHICITCLPSLQPCLNTNYKVTSYPTSYELDTLPQLNGITESVLLNCGKIKQADINHHEVHSNLAKRSMNPALTKFALKVMRLMTSIAVVLDSVIVSCAFHHCTWEGRYGELVSHLTLHSGNTQRDIPADHNLTEMKQACWRSASTCFSRVLHMARKELGLFPKITTPPATKSPLTMLQQMRKSHYRSNQLLSNLSSQKHTENMDAYGGAAFTSAIQRECSHNIRELIYRASLASMEDTHVKASLHAIINQVLRRASTINQRIGASQGSRQTSQFAPSFAKSQSGITLDHRVNPRYDPQAQNYWTGESCHAAAWFQHDRHKMRYDEIPPLISQHEVDPYLYLTALTERRILHMQQHPIHHPVLPSINQNDGESVAWIVDDPRFLIPPSDILPPPPVDQVERCLVTESLLTSDYEIDTDRILQTHEDDSSSIVESSLEDQSSYSSVGSVDGYTQGSRPRVRCSSTTSADEENDFSHCDGSSSDLLATAGQRIRNEALPEYRKSSSNSTLVSMHHHLNSLRSKKATIVSTGALSSSASAGPENNSS